MEMAQEGTRRRRQSRLFDILVVPVGEGRKSRAFRASRPALILIAIAAVFAVIGATLAVLIYTPVAMYVPIPNPELEQRYGRQIRETQERLNALAEDVILLRDYNRQLRKALGEATPRDTSMVRPALPVRGTETAGLLGDSILASEVTTDGPMMDDYSMVSDRVEGGPAGVESPARPMTARFPMMMPGEGFVTQNFDPENNHLGMDLAGKRGSPVFAAADGYVVFSGWTPDDGNVLILAHGGGYITVYKHNQALLVSTQQRVGRGAPVALLGSSGRTSLGPHLHFEVWNNGIPEDPNRYLLAPVAR
jgi:murein DD-endopeptidase MepM/ murein hydrolase activator NlpD